MQVIITKQAGMHPALSRTFAQIFYCFIALYLLGCDDRVDEMSSRNSINSNHKITLGKLPENIIITKEAQIKGRLVIVDGCVSLRSDQHDQTYTLLVPEHYKLSDAPGPSILDDGVVKGVLNGEVILGGGSSDTLPDNSDPLTAKCSAPYWMVSSVQTVD